MFKIAGHCFYSIFFSFYLSNVLIGAHRSTFFVLPIMLHMRIFVWTLKEWILLIIHVNDAYLQNEWSFNFFNKAFEFIISNKSQHQKIKQLYSSLCFVPFSWFIWKRDFNLRTLILQLYHLTSWSHKHMPKTRRSKKLIETNWT